MDDAAETDPSPLQVPGKPPTMALADKTALFGIAIGILVAAAGVAMPLAFDVAPWAWRSVFCVGVLIAAALIAHLLYEHLVRSHSDRRTRTWRTIVLGCLSVGVCIGAIWASVALPQPKNYFAILSAKIDALGARFDKNGRTQSVPQQPFALPAGSAPVTSSLGGWPAGAKGTRDPSRTDLAPAKPERTAPSVFLECVPGTPSVVPPTGVYRALELQSRAGAASEGAFALMFGNAGASTGINIATVGLAYRCELTNYGPEPVTDVKLRIRLVYIGAEKTINGFQGNSDRMEVELLATSPKIDPGRDNAFTFYIWNVSREFVELTFESNLNLRVISEAGSRDVRLDQPAPVPRLEFNPRP